VVVVRQFGVGRGHSVPDRNALRLLTAAPRQTMARCHHSMACALPDAECGILPFEQFAGNQTRLMALPRTVPRPQTCKSMVENRLPCTRGGKLRGAMPNTA